jgi:hypothetical protein
MTYRMGEETAAHVAALVTIERPEWEPALVKIVLLSHAHAFDGSDLAVAAIRCAQDPASPAPKAIAWNGPHWRGLKTQPTPPMQRVLCKVCGKPEPVCVYNRPGIDDDHAFEGPDS